MMRILQGETKPRAEQKHLYQLNTVIPDYNTSIFSSKKETKYIWTLYKFKNNQWQQVEGNIKYGEKNYYLFGQGVVGIPFKIIIHSQEKNLLQAIQNVKVAEITVVPKTAKEPIIGRVILLNKGKKDVNKAKFNEQLTAQARTSNLLGQEITFYLWEEGASEFEKYKKPKKGRVNKYGIAEVQFNLSEYASQQTWMNFFQPNSNTTKKFFVTATYEDKKENNRTPVTATNNQPQAPRAPQQPTSTPSQPTQKNDSDALTKFKEIIAEGLGSFLNSFENVVSASQVDPASQRQINSEEKKGKCFCNRDFTVEEFEKIIHSLRDSEAGVKRDSGYNLFEASNCPLPVADRTIEALRNKINNLFSSSYEINSCIRKIHFLAQVYHETDRFRTTLEYATKKSYKPYFGRGLMQLTWESNYKIYESYSGVNCVRNYEKIANNFNYACDSAGWYWKQGKVLGVGKRWKGPANPPLYVKIQKPDYPKKTIEWKDGNETKKYGTVNLGLIADDDKVDLISYLVNGGANGLQERRNYVLTLKNIFQYPQICINKKASKKPVSSASERVTIRLVRKWQTNKSTIGEFTIDNTDIKGYFLEEKGPDTTTSGVEQRVPIGTYNLEWHFGTKIKKGLKLYNDVVSKDRAILIHSGNTADDTEGCLIAGSSKSVDFVGGSRDKLKEIFDFVEEIGIKDAQIIITQAYE